MRALAAFALALGLLLHGCAEPEADAAESSPSTTSSSSQTSANGTAASPEILVEDVTFTWSGHTKEGAWVCDGQSGLGQCPAGQQVAPDGGHVYSITYSGNASRLDFTMTWQADPTQTGLVVGVYGNRTSGGFGPIASGWGDSPLTLALDLAAVGLVPDDAIVLIVWPEGKTPTSPSVFVDATQAQFAVEGTLRQSRPPPPA